MGTLKEEDNLDQNVPILGPNRRGKVDPKIISVLKEVLVQYLNPITGMFSFQVSVQCVRVCLCVFCVYSVCSVVCQKGSHHNERLAAFAYISSLQNGLYLGQK